MGALFAPSIVEACSEGAWYSPTLQGENGIKTVDNDSEHHYADNDAKDSFALGFLGRFGRGRVIASALTVWVLGRALTLRLTLIVGRTEGMSLIARGPLIAAMIGGTAILIAAALILSIVLRLRLGISSRAVDKAAGGIYGVCVVFGIILVSSLAVLVFIVSEFIEFIDKPPNKFFPTEKGPC